MWVATVAIIVLVINDAIAVVTVFRQPRDIAATWAWLLVLLLLPVIGFILYWLFGRKLSTKKLTSMATQRRLGIDKLVQNQQEAIAVGQDLIGTDQNAGLPELVRALLRADGALVTTMNHVELLPERDPYTKRLFADIAAAVNHVHIEAYRIEPDDTGRALAALLTKQAQAGVRVRLIYDAFGSHRIKPRFWQALRAAGGQVETFIGTKFSRVNPRINFRNHRKIVVVDGKIGYMGGYDIGQSPHRKKAVRDSPLRITGQAVAVLQARFFMDWNTSAKIQKVHFQQTYFPPSADDGHTTMQIVSGGPEQPVEAIKLGYMRLISLAKKRIWIQTPYFVPDDSLLDALIIAANSGIDVRIMVPRHTNQPAMARASRYYLDQLVKRGASVFYFNAGFLHAKAIIVDGQYLATGTANLDVRSFRLNFEITAFIYDRGLAQEAARLFENELTQANAYTTTQVQNKSRRTQLGDELSRLLAPIL